MFNVIFEVKPKRERFDAYLSLGAHLKPMLESTEGFIDNERFASVGREGWILSLSTWRDEKSLVRWRTHGEHHRVQERGRDEIFDDYHLRVGEVTLDSDATPGTPLPQQRFDETQTATAKFVSLTEVTPGQSGGDNAHRLAERLAPPLSDAELVDFDAFESIYKPGKVCLLLSWKTAAAAGVWVPPRLDGVAAQRHRIVRVVRDYGMRERREAPQYYPEASAANLQAPQESLSAPQGYGGRR